MIDLHAHTTASDGTFSPRQLVQLAHEIGLDAVGVTDHDTIAAWPKALKAGQEFGVEVVPGVELSTSYFGGRFHLLGYYVNPQSELITVLDEIQKARRERNEQIFAKLEELKVPLQESEVRAIAGRDDGELGRPHFAQAMLKRGYVSSLQEAFDKYLADGSAAYIPKKVLSPQEAITAIHAAGGVAIWAHPPLNRKLNLMQLEERLRDWVEWGLDGLETYYFRYTPEETAWAKQVCEQYKIIGSGGSDFHGAAKPDVKLGITNTGKAVPNEVLDQIKSRRDELKEEPRA
jgi:predicted metal-dependent phosphoesterase TrpH